MELPQAERPDLPGRFIRTVFVASNVRQGGRGTYESAKQWDLAKVHLLLEIDLRLVEDAEVQRLRLCTPEDAESIPREMIECSTLKLEDKERVVGFKWNEVQCRATGSTVYFNVRVLLKEEGDDWPEPLSRELFPKEYDFPGHEVTMQCRTFAAEVRAFNAFRGRQRHHITGLTFQSWSSVECATGRDLMFWVDLLMLTGGLYYLDVGTDVQQLFLFSEENYDYLALNIFGIAIPMVTTAMDALKWSEGAVARPQADWVKRIIPFSALRASLIVVLVLTQCHMLLLVVASASMRIKHDLLLGAKHAEVAEAVVSAGLQSNYWFLLLVGIQSVSGDAFQSLTFSLTVSCMSLAFGFATRDKTDTRVLNVPGKLGWSPTFAALFSARVLEITSRLLAFNMIHLATRTAVPIGGPVAVALMVAAAWFVFPEADKSLVLAAVIGHPGQVMLGMRSCIPLRFSIRMHALLQLIAVILQGLVRINESLLPEARAVPWAIVVVSLATSIGSSLGLCWLSHIGDGIRHPVLEEAGKGEALTCTKLAAALGLSQLPLPVLAAADELSLDLEALEDDRILLRLATAKTPVIVPSFCMKEVVSKCDQPFEQLQHINVIHADFSECDADLTSLEYPWDRLEWMNLKVIRFKERKVPAALMAMLARCKQLEEVIFAECQETDDAAWEHLEDSQWLKLRMADFAGCFEGCDRKGGLILQTLFKSTKLEVLDWSRNGFWLPEAEADLLASNPQCNKPAASPWTWRNLEIVRFEGGKIPAAVLIMLARCERLEEIKFDWCGSTDCWEHLKDAQWPKLKVANFHRCFLEDTKAGAMVLQTLARSAELEVLDFDLNCTTTEEWDELFAQGYWPKLQWEKCDFGDHRPSDRFRPRAAAESAEILPRYVTHVEMQNEAGHLDASVLPWLAKCRDIEFFHASSGTEMPVWAWQSLEKATWPNLRVANFWGCFDELSEGLDGAPAVLQLLARSRHLEIIDLDGCGHIAAAAWELLREAQWMELKEASWYFCFRRRAPARDKAGVVMQLMSRCESLEKISLRSCNGISDEDFKLLGGASWPELRDANFADCFEECETSTRRTVLQALSRCRKLERLNFASCETTAEDLLELPSGCWPNLKLEECRGFECSTWDDDGTEMYDMQYDMQRQLQRLRQADLEATGSSGLSIQIEEPAADVPDVAAPGTDEEPLQVPGGCLPDLKSDDFDGSEEQLDPTFQESEQNQANRLSIQPEEPPFGEVENAGAKKAKASKSHGKAKRAKIKVKAKTKARKAAADEMSARESFSTEVVEAAHATEDEEEPLAQDATPKLGKT
ncbi:unnamed protein product [Symbiodinium natans]|uniref:Uncharacterized protein n=1 Tax=Symbiodinium natans TaxID=878477 RepID=A0A812S7F9_9DINO|nr:unnamed protein product [Symbiodinium natans]